MFKSVLHFLSGLLVQACTVVVETATESLTWLGRFHPLLIHFPFGLMCAMLVVLLLLGRNAKESPKILVILWLITTLSAWLAVGSGLLLGSDDGYDYDALEAHKRSGLILAFSLTAGLLLLWKFPAKRRLQWLALGFSGLWVVVAGHLGGNLTHGETYLTETMPAPLAKLVGVARVEKVKINQLSEALAYRDLVQPILNKHCTQCHNLGKRKGDLLLNSYPNLMAGGEHGQVIEPKDPTKSPLIQRILLPADDEKAMPPDGKAKPSDQEIQFLQWWISNGASGEANFLSLKPPTAIEAWAEQYLGLSKQNPLPIVAQADTAALAKARKAGFIITRIAKNSELLDVGIGIANKKVIGDSAIATLKPLAKAIFWLDLGGSSVSDAGFAALGNLPVCQRLILKETALGDKTIKPLQAMSQLQVLVLGALPWYETVRKALPNKIRIIASVPPDSLLQQMPVGKDSIKLS